MNDEDRILRKANSKKNKKNNKKRHKDYDNDDRMKYRAFKQRRKNMIEEDADNEEDFYIYEN